MATKKQQSEQADARATLRTWIKPGDTIFTVMRHVSRSGMQREIDLLKVDGSEISWLSGMAGKALDLRRGKRDGLVVTGCGMDMGFHLVYELSHVLFPDGFGCIGQSDDRAKHCPSNDHSNGDRDYTPHEIAAPRACPGCDGTGKVKQFSFSRSHADDVECRTCQGKGKLDAGHWHSSGGYALRHRWL